MTGNSGNMDLRSLCIIHDIRLSLYSHAGETVIARWPDICSVSAEMAVEGRRSFITNTAGTL